MIHYIKPLYAEPIFDSYKVDKNQFPVTEKLTNELLSLPIYPELLDEEVDLVGESLSKFS
jgi:dTDP-4-amino-4,6-dideoxygalactose transaminase